MTLSELAGPHLLDAVDFGSIKRMRYGDDEEESSVLWFRLDGQVFGCVEDPGDGYRSSMDELLGPTDRPMGNVFPAVKVIGAHRTKGEFGGEDDVLYLIAERTGRVVLSAGTENVDDYYPSFIAFFDPKELF